MINNEQQDVIYFFSDDVNGHCIWREDFAHSIAYDQYKSAISILERIVKTSSRKEGFDKSNIVAFCGDRGEGKSSCLETVSAILRDKCIYNQAVREGLINDQSCLDCDNLFVLDTIDPSFFDDNHNIIELVLGQLFAKLMEATEDNCSFGDISGVIKQFEVVKRSLKHINKQKSDKINIYDAVEELDELAAGIRLQSELQELFRVYTRLMAGAVCDRSEKTLKQLVICIDDIDLNLTGAYEMVEQVRKYLSNKYCIVLIAVKIDQLANVIKTNIKNRLNDKSYSDDDLYQMSIAFVNKFIPMTNRVYMPKVEHVSEKKLEVRDGLNKTLYGPLPIKEVVVRKIFEKTRYIFYNGRSVSPIVPDTLRGLRHLLELLDTLPDAKRDDDSDNIPNKKLFCDYFFHTWTKCLDIKDRDFAESLVEYQDVTSINKSVVSYLYTHIVKQYKEEHNLDIPTRLFEPITSPENKSFNVSVGDVFYLLNQVDTGSASRSTNLLLFFIRSFYSMRLYDYYNEISKDETLLHPSAELTSVMLHKNESLYQNTNVLQRFVNGSYFTYVPGILMSKELNEIPRDYRAIDGRQLFEDAKKCEDLIKRQNETRLTPGEEEQLQKLVLVCEFFSLTTVRPVKKDNLNEEYLGLERRSVEIPYLTKYARDERYLLFDMLSPFCNLINLQYAYNRISPILYDYCVHQEWSLLNRMIQSVYRDRGMRYHFDGNSTWEQMHTLISDAIIRISDIIPSIIDECRVNKRNVHKRDGASHLINAYKAIQNIGFTLYSLDDTSEPHTIRFAYLTPVIEILDGVIKDEFEKIYGGIAKTNTVLLRTSKEEAKKDLETWFGSAINSKRKFPKTGRQIRNLLSGEAKDNYNQCGGQRFWNGLFSYQAQYGIEDVWKILLDHYEEIRVKMEAKS